MTEFNVELPTLIQQLKSILDQYQDDGQILKELIQNAEDASARTVKFLLDEHCYKSERLLHPELSKFQGPALYAYNDALFTDDDWKSLSRWSNSIKKDDPTKVGRFGLGFKSVFHMTDLPMIMSGDKVCAIDPHMLYFQKNGKPLSGYSWHRHNDAKVLVDAKDQFEPLANIFEEKTGPFEEAPTFNGTLFRFPLRLEPSEICDNLYNAEKVKTLFASFKMVAEHMLLFLMSVERIELYVREASAMKPTLVLCVNVQKQIAHDLHLKRQEFVCNAKKVRNAPNEEACLTAELVLERFTKGVSTADRHVCSTYLVSHYCGWAASCEGSNRANEISKKLSYLPWASTAAKLLPGSDTEPQDWMEPCPKPRGQLFCFLPLPLQSDSPTGLPVHVNGFLALSSSRHEVKWPSINDSGTSDEACQWNKYLVENVVPRAYANMVLELIRMVTLSSSSNADGQVKTTRHAVYSLFPDPDAVVDRWRETLGQFYGIVFKECVTYVQTESGGGGFLPLDITVIPNAEEDQRIRSAIARYFAVAALPDIAGLAEVPPHVLMAIDMYVSPSPPRMTSAALRTTLRRNPDAINHLSNDDRLAILEFVLKANDDCYHELFGLPILPLLNGSFTSFTSTAQGERVYIASAEHPQLLLPRLENMFLDDSEKINDVLKKMLAALATRGQTNLCHFNANCFKLLCRSTVTSEHFAQENYGKELWQYLHKYFPKDLSDFEGLPLLLSTAEPPTIGYASHPLSRETPLLTADCREYRLNETACNALRRLGVAVVRNIVPIVWSHPAVPSVYVYAPSPTGIIEALCRLKSKGKLISKSWTCLTAPEKLALREELERLDLRKSLTQEQRKLLKSMPLFEVKGRQGIFVSAAEVDEAAPLSNHPPLPNDCRLLDITVSSELLANKLGVQRLGLAELFKRHLKPVMERPECSKQYIDQVMTKVLQNLALYEQEDSSFISLLASLQFVSRQDGKTVAPFQACDPDDTALREILIGQKLYPSTPYNEVAILPALRRLGLCNVSTVTDELLFECAQSVSEFYGKQPLHRVGDLTRKSRGILKFIDANTDHIGKRAFELLNACKWLIPLPSPPGAYPTTMEWFGRNQQPVSPSTVYDIRYVTVVGSCAALLPHPVNSSLSNKFGWNKRPPAKIILENLRNAIKAYRPSEKAAFLQLVCNTYDILQSLTDQELHHGFSATAMREWIWHGDGFAQPQHMVLQSTEIDCKPYFHVVPNEMQKYKNFLIKVGVIQQWNDDLYLDVLHMVKEMHASGIRSAHQQALTADRQLSVNIVQKLATTWDSLSAEAKERLIIPAATDGLTLVPVKDCTYSYSRSLNEIHFQATSEEETPVIFVHPAIGPVLAETLGVPSLASREIDADGLEIGEGFGQCESLTTRLNRLLQDYADGLAVPKELIQNADDAGATEVKFIYDERFHADSCLIDDGMSECQGPALWVYNNSVFSDQDFQDITKMSNPQKARRSDQIGGFGLGFNSVYNLTDVPSFLSRDCLVILDPHKYHLGKSLPGSNQPGIKFNFPKNKRVLRTFCNQFLPYEGVCECNIMSWLDTSGHFNGTLFRLPLRTPGQASRSEISNKIYDKKEVAQLFEMLADACQTVLLFTQNVFSVSALHIPKDGNPREPRMLFKVTKKLEKVIRKLNQPASVLRAAGLLSEEEKELVRNANILSAAATAKSSFQEKSQSICQPVSSMLLKIHYEENKEICNDLLQSPRKSNTTVWLVVNCMGLDEALTFSMEHKHLSPTGGVAAQVSVKGKGFAIHPLVLRDKNGRLAGQIFCYLPLPIRSQLPVHINGAFQVHSSRTALVTASGDKKNNVSAWWNNCLMEDAIAKAYIILLEDLKDMCAAPSAANAMMSTTNVSSYSYHDLWPIVDRVSADCKALASRFYCTLADAAINEPDSLRLLSDGVQWVSLSKSFMLDSDIKWQPSIAKAATIALTAFLKNQHQHCGVAVIDMPSEIRHGFSTVKHEYVLQQQTYDKIKLFWNILPTVAILPEEVRDALVLHALDLAAKNDKLKEILVGEPCIPVSPSGKELKRIGQLVHPMSRIACLYSPNEGRFPFGNKETYLEDQRLLVLTKLGMLNKDMTEKELMERASKSLSLYDPYDKRAHTLACQRASMLLNIIEELLEKQQSLSKVKGELCEAKFLPVLSSHHQSICKWKGDDMNVKLLSPSELYPAETESLLCYVEPLLDEASLSNVRGFPKTKEFLELNREIPLDAVLRQLSFVTKNKEKLLGSCLQQTKRIMSSIYQFLQDNLEDAIKELKNASQVCFVIVDDTFVHPEDVCVEAMVKDCKPYLYQLPAEFRKFQTLFNRLGSKNIFTVDSYVSALRLMKTTQADKALKKKDLDIAVNISHLLHEALQTTDKCDFQSDVYLPDSHQVLRRASELSFDNCPWLNNDEEEELLAVHEMIPYPVAHALGVHTIRENTLQRHHYGRPFGQKEELVDRIARIMSAYPRSKEMFYELLQNADDSGATEVHFIKDYRYHPTEKIFEDSWKPLQGPALCVFNNKAFTKSDLEGIQSLGMGSKAADPIATGQYGVGFNSVYHLTDVPSIITSGKEIGEVLCVLDPHCRFVPGATDDRPGRQYTNLQKLRKKFPDVFSCYLENLLPLSEGTLFRFPLRTLEMAESSKLCSTEISEKDLNILLEKFTSEIFEVLLFVNNLEKVKISEVSPDGLTLKTVHTLQASLSDEDASKRRDFYQYVRECSEALRSKKKDIWGIEVRQVCYTVTLEDDKKHKEHWRVVQRIGFESSANVEKASARSFTSGTFHLLPRGGVAGVITDTYLWRERRRKKRVFCFLPLPLETQLPVHVNGHFALDYESRRGLWLHDEGGGWRTQWNMTLLKDVIAPSYIDFLKDCRDQVIADMFIGKPTSRLDKALQTYFAHYPSVDLGIDSTWSRLSKFLYQKIHEDKEQLLPLLKTINKSGEKNEVENLQWLPIVTDDGTSTTFFDDLGDSEQLKIKDIMIRAGLRWVHDPLGLGKLFEASGVPVHRLSPNDVINFLRSEHCQHPVPLPCALEQSIYRKKSDVVSVTLYCLKNIYEFWANVENLPLGLSQANRLHYLSSKNPLIISNCNDLLPSSSDAFLHSSLQLFFWPIPTKVSEKANRSLSASKTSHDCELEECEKSLEPPAVFKSLTVSDLESRLHQELDERFCSKDDGPVPWEPNSVVLPTQEWLSELWKYLSTQRGPNTGEHDVFDRSRENEMLCQMVGCLSEWTVIPAMTEAIPARQHIFQNTNDCKHTHFLVSIKNRKAIVDYATSTSNPKDNEPVKEVLSILAVLKLNEEIFRMKYTKVALEGLSLVKQLTASLNNPADVLESVLFALRFTAEIQQKSLNSDHRRTLLNYFATGLPRQESDTCQIIQRNLRLLPFYETQAGDLVALNHEEVVILRKTIPKDGFDKWTNTLDMIFLKEDSIPENLAKFLQCKYLEVDDAYYNFIFPQFPKLGDTGREAHLTYIRDEWLRSTTADNKEKLINCLKQLAFLDSGGGNLRCASSFYDPQNDLLTSLWEADRFPPEKFRHSHWIEFLKTIGLQTQPTSDVFIELANDIARLSKVHDTGGITTLGKKLISQLFESENLDWTLLHSIRTIPFICSSDNISNIKKLALPCVTEDSEPLFIQFEGSITFNTRNVYCSWSTAKFLPEWADPFSMNARQLPYDKSRWKDWESFRDFVANGLGIRDSPREGQISAHVENLIRASQDAEVLQNTKLDKIMQVIYVELHKRISKNLATKKKFASLPLILLRDSDGSATFVRASQLVLNIHHSRQVRPYIIKAPETLAMYGELLTHLGAKQEPSTGLYSSLLAKLYATYKGRKLAQNDLEASYKSFRWLVGYLLTDEKTSQLNELYFPSVNGCLYSSVDLVYNDYPLFADRLTSSSFNEPYMVDLKVCNVERPDFEEAMRKIPEDKRPRSLFRIIEEKVLDPMANFGLAAAASPDRLQTLLRSEIFHEGLWRLIWHANIDSENKPSEQVKQDLKNALRSIEVRKSHKLVTYLSYKGLRMEGSNAETDCFLNRVDIGTRFERYVIYTNVSDSLSMKTVIRVAEMIHKLSDGLLRCSVLYLYPLLLCEPCNIDSLLDELRIATQGGGAGLTLRQSSE